MTGLLEHPISRGSLRVPGRRGNRAAAATGPPVRAVAALTPCARNADRSTDRIADLAQSGEGRSGIIAQVAIIRIAMIGPQLALVERPGDRAMTVPWAALHPLLPVAP